PGRQLVDAQPGETGLRDQHRRRVEDTGADLVVGCLQLASLPLPGPYRLDALPHRVELYPLLANRQPLSARPRTGEVAEDACQGQREVISTSSVKDRNVRMATIPASTPTDSKVGSTTTVRMMSPATSSSSPSRIDRPIERRTTW